MARSHLFLNPSSSLFGTAGSMAWYIALLACALVFCAPGCHMIVPSIKHEPAVQNPFPQLSSVAVAPFFNQSNEPTLDARRFSLAYFEELQAVPGFEVVPLSVVEQAIVRHRIDLTSDGEARRLAEILGVDAVVIGSITDYSPYTPPHCGLRVEWYAANPGFHEIPAGYGLPWGTPEEEFIPSPLVYEAEMALAKAQLATQTPDCSGGNAGPLSPTGGQQGPQLVPTPPSAGSPEDGEFVPAEPLPMPQAGAGTAGELSLAAAFADLPTESDSSVMMQTTATGRTGDAIVATDMLPPDWPDGSGLIPAPPSPVRPPCCLHYGPVMTHTRIYQSDDAAFTEALIGYVGFRNDDRFGGWQTHLQRSDDFIRFCCHLHIAEMLSARGGAGQTRVVCEWHSGR